MAAMTNVAVPVSDGTDHWTLIYTAGGTVTLNVQNRHPQADLLIRVNGSSGATTDAKDAAAEWLRPFDRMSMTLASGDKVLARTVRDEVPGRLTYRV